MPIEGKKEFILLYVCGAGRLPAPRRVRTCTINVMKRVKRRQCAKNFREQMTNFIEGKESKA